MKKTRKQNHASMWGYIIFFLTVSVVVTVALSAFMMVNRKSEGDQGLITATMFLVIVFISGGVYAGGRYPKKDYGRKAR